MKKQILFLWTLLLVSVGLQGTLSEFTQEEIASFFQDITDDNCDDIEKKLLKRPEYANVINNILDSPLICAVERYRGKIAELLLSSPLIDINYKNPTQSKSALHAAVSSESPYFVALLCAYDADVHIKDEYGRTPLHWAAMKEDFKHTIKNVQILLFFGADPTMESGSRTPLHIAQDYYYPMLHKQIINILYNATEAKKAGQGFDPFADIPLQINSSVLGKNFGRRRLHLTYKERVQLWPS